MGLGEMGQNRESHLGQISYSPAMRARHVPDSQRNIHFVSFLDQQLITVTLKTVSWT